MRKPARKCKHTKADWLRCKASPRPGGPFCLFHDPQMAKARRAGRKAGGVNRSRKAAILPANSPDLPLSSVTDVASFLATAINEVRRGQLDPRVGNCIGVLAGQLLKALEGSLLEEQ